MKMSQEMQKDILLKSFDVLKSGFKENHEDIRRIIGRMAALDISIAMDMWEYIIKLNSDIVINSGGTIYWTGTTSKELLSWVIDEMHDNLGYEYSIIAKAIRTHTFIRNIVFGKSAHVGSYEARVIAEYILDSDFETASEALSLVEKNTCNQEKKIGEVLQVVIDYVDRNQNLTDSHIGFIYDWVQSINDESQKAKASVNLIKLIK